MFANIAVPLASSQKHHGWLAIHGCGHTMCTEVKKTERPRAERQLTLKVGRCAWRVLHSAFLFLCSVFLAEFFASSRLRVFLAQFFASSRGVLPKLWLCFLCEVVPRYVRSVAWLTQLT